MDRSQPARSTKARENGERDAQLLDEIVRDLERLAPAERDVVIAITEVQRVASECVSSPDAGQRSEHLGRMAVLLDATLQLVIEQLTRALKRESGQRRRRASRRAATATPT